MAPSIKYLEARAAEVGAHDLLEEIKRLRQFEADVELELAAWLDTSDATKGMTPTERVLLAVRTIKSYALQAMKGQ